MSLTLPQLGLSLAAGSLTTLSPCVFPLLPLSIQAILVPALSKAWKQWAQDQGAKEHALEAAKSVRYLQHAAMGVG